jgi:hypothetical protein
LAGRQLAPAGSDAGDEESDSGEQLGVLAGHAQRHQAAGGAADEIDAVGIGNAALHQIGHEELEERHVVERSPGRFEHHLAERSGLLAGRQMIPTLRAAFGKHRGKAALWRKLAEAGCVCFPAPHWRPRCAAC